MDGRTNGWMDGRVEEWTDGWKSGRTKGWIDGWMDNWNNKGRKARANRSAGPDDTSESDAGVVCRCNLS